MKRISLLIMIKVVIISFFLALVLLAGLNRFFPLPDQIEYSTIITDSKGDVIHAFLTRDDKWRMKTSPEELSPLMKSTIIEKEDKLFYYHAGINPFAITRAFVKNLIYGKRTSGASTITMQVARAMEPKRRNYTNKLKEIFRAAQLEWKYSKDEILLLYCNLLPYGSNIEGIKSASLLYFKKDPDHLSLAEITALCIIPNRPSSLVPGKNNKAIIKERNRWLKRFAVEKVFTPKQIEDALTEPFNATRGTVPRLAPHLANSLRHTGQPLIRTAININIQLQSEKIVADYSRALQYRNIHNAAVVILENVSHKVITYIGSADFYDTTDGGQVDGVKAVRQPGSTLKPFMYGMCIDQGLITPKSVLSDVATNYGGYSPENFNKQFNGKVSMEYALEHSLNIPAVRSLKMLGKDKFISALGACNFSQIKKDQKKLGLSLILGGCGASLMELTGLYAALANGGVYSRPSFTNEKTSSHAFQLLSPAATFMINETLSKINRPDFPLNWQSTEHMPKIAWKTGTSYGRRDAWSIGYNKKYTVGIWVGNFSGAGVSELSGAEIATPLLFKIFNSIDYDSDEEWFTQPKDCEIRMVCPETGVPPGEHCPGLVSDYFIPMVSVSIPCNNMEEMAVSADGKWTYCKTCIPETGYRKKLYKIIPPEMQAYYDEHRIIYEKPPPHNPACPRIFNDGQPLILSPKNGMEYLLTKKNPEPLQLLCRTGNDVSRVYWYVNDQFYKTGTSGAPVFFVAGEGPVKISCTDDKGRNKDIWINVRQADL